MLLVVTVWRVSLWLFFLRRGHSLAWGPAVNGTLLPVILIIVCLTILNLEKAVFDLMGGIRTTQTSADQSYAVLFSITMLSQLAILPVLGLYVYYVYRSKTAGGVANPADTAE